MQADRRDELLAVTAGGLLVIHNERCRPEDRIEGPWKASKAKLIERIESLGDGTSTDAAPRTAADATVDDAEQKATGKATVRALAEAMLTATDGAVASYDEIVARIKEAIPGSGPTPKSIAWYASHLRKRGIDVPVRRRARA